MRSWSTRGLRRGRRCRRPQLGKERAAAGPWSTVVSHVYVDPASGKHSFAVQVPVVRNDKPIYYLSIAGYAHALQSVLEDQGLPEDRVVSILDADGVVVARNHDAGNFVGKRTSARLQAQLARIPRASSNPKR